MNNTLRSQLRVRFGKGAVPLIFALLRAVPYAPRPAVEDLAIPWPHQRTGCLNGIEKIEDVGLVVLGELRMIPTEAPLRERSILLRKPMEMPTASATIASDSPRSSLNRRGAIPTDGNWALFRLALAQQAVLLQ